MTKLFYKFPVSSNLIKFTDMELLDDDNVETMLSQQYGVEDPRTEVPRSFVHDFDIDLNVRCSNQYQVSARTEANTSSPSDGNYRSSVCRIAKVSDRVGAWAQVVEAIADKDGVVEDLIVPYVVGLTSINHCISRATHSLCTTSSSPSNE
ncbi:hypothetical protein GOBAR_DD33388 [Gossypium barbadense]|nr:hypothetical protein GOBAR_DD33388 [Gossypium barbadense]